MHDFIVNIGYQVCNFFANMDTGNLLQALKIMGIGMLGIFIVTGVIIGVVMLLGKIFSK